MAGKSGKKETGRKPSTSTRTSAKTDGASGKEQFDQLKEGAQLNVDKGTRGRAGKA